MVTDKHVRRLNLKTTPGTEHTGTLAHEDVIVKRDPRTGLQAVIAIHSTAMGPAAGGCRRWTYLDEQAAVTDAKRLSEGMTYKNALAGVPFGGGKSVILADHNAKPTPDQLEVFAGWLNELDGRYITAEDVGMGVAEMHQLARFTPHVSGLGRSGVGGDPSPKTAQGVFIGLKTAVRHKFGRASLAGRSVAVQGLGAVGWSLCERLAQAGAQIYVADLDSDRAARAAQTFGAKVVAVEDITRLEVDVFAPCALGGVITEELATELSVQVIAGAANNQLATHAAGRVLTERDIVYAPDFVINAGGVISVAHEHLAQNGYFAKVNAERWVDERIEGIAQRLDGILQQAEREGVSTDRVARNAALDVIGAGVSGTVS